MHTGCRQRWGTPILGMALAAALSRPAAALDLGPKDLPLKVAGLVIAIPANAALDLQAAADGVHFKAVAKGDLQPIQDKALEIARRLPLPRDKCAKRGVSIVV